MIPPLGCCLRYRSPARTVGRVRQASALAKMRMRLRAFQQSLEAKVQHLNESSTSSDTSVSLGFSPSPSAARGRGRSKSPLSIYADSDDAESSLLGRRSGRRREHATSSPSQAEDVSLLSDDLDEKFQEVDRVHSQILASLGPNVSTTTTTTKVPPPLLRAKRLGVVGAPTRLSLIHI